MTTQERADMLNEIIGSINGLVADLDELGDHDTIAYTLLDINMELGVELGALEAEIEVAYDRDDRDLTDEYYSAVL